MALVGSLLPRPSPRLRRLAVGACACAAVVASAGAMTAHAWKMHIAVLDVGQGLAAAILIPGRRSLLYDAGPRWREYDTGERVVVPALRRLGVRRLDDLLISHAHPDHEGGAAAVRREMGGETIRGVTPGPPDPRSGLRLGGGISLRVLHSGADPAAAPQKDENDRSLALLVSCGETGMVFTGDAGPVPLRAIIDATRPLPPHLALQVPHHGGSQEACRLLAEALRPELSAISVGRNGYGHPRPEAVAALSLSGRVLRTDRDGAIFIRSDGRRLEVRTWRELATARTWSERVRWLVAGW
jgi:competence protein ComEC